MHHITLYPNVHIIVLPSSYENVGNFMATQCKEITLAPILAAFVVLQYVREKEVYMFDTCSKGKAIFSSSLTSLDQTYTWSDMLLSDGGREGISISML